MKSTACGVISRAGGRPVEAGRAHVNGPKHSRYAAQEGATAPTHRQPIGGVKASPLSRDVTVCSVAETNTTVARHFMEWDLANTMAYLRCAATAATHLLHFHRAAATELSEFTTSPAARVLGGCCRTTVGTAAAGVRSAWTFDRVRRRRHLIYIWQL